MKAFLIGLFCLPIFFFLSSVFAWPVKADACIDATCYTTIQEAVDAALANATINVQNGTYTSPVVISKPLTIVGENTDLTIVETGNSNIAFSYLTGSDGSVLKNFKITGNGDGINAGDISNLTLQDLIVDNNAFAASGVYLSNVTTVNISNSTFSNNIVGIDLTGTTSGVTISTGTFTNNSTYHISNDTPNEVTASDGNSWGAFNANDINTLLYDTKDSEILGRVVFDATAPSVDAGIDKSANASFTQNATVSDTFGVSTYLWSQDSGPGTVTFDDTAIEDPQISADSEGTYVIRLTATDTSGNTADDTFQLTWDTTPPQLDSAWTQDSDHDGHIDTIKMTFNENIGLITKTW